MWWWWCWVLCCDVLCCVVDYELTDEQNGLLIYMFGRLSLLRR